MRYSPYRNKTDLRSRRSPLKLNGMPGVVFGTSSFGNLYRCISDCVKTEIVKEMQRHHTGIFVVDSAGKYGAGLALESLGRTLENLNVPKQRLLISNKLGWRRVPLETKEPTFEPGVWVGLEHDAVQDISYYGILRCWEEGNNLLGNYEAQLVSVHDPDEYLAAAESDEQKQDRWNDIIGAYQALSELRANDLVKAVGVGSKDWRVSKRIAESCELDWVMLANSLTVYRHEPELLEFIDWLHARNIMVINSAIFHGGFLVGGQFFDYRELDPESKHDLEIIQWREKFNSICNDFDVLPANACAEFAFSHPGIASLALNTSRPSYVKTNIQLPSVRLDNEFWVEMKNQSLIRSNFRHVGDLV